MQHQERVISILFILERANNALNVHVAYWQKLYEDQKAYIEQTVKDDKAINELEICINN